MKKQKNFEEEKYNAQKLYFLLHANFFDDFKYRINKLYASFKNKEYLDYKYEDTRETRKEELSSFYHNTLSNSKNTNYKKILSDIYYEKDTKKSYIILDENNYTDDMFLSVLIEKMKKEVNELNTFRQYLFVKSAKFDFLSTEQKIKLSESVDDYIDITEDFVHSQEILHADFFRDIDEIIVDSEPREEGPIIIDQSHVLDKSIENTSKTNINKFMHSKTEIKYKEKNYGFKELNIDYDKLLDDLINKKGDKDG